MNYSDIAIAAFALAVMNDLFGFKTSMLTRPAFWTSYAIILPFQFLTNWWLTSRNIVMYDPDAIVGLRFFSAPAEDVLFGFALNLQYGLAIIGSSVPSEFLLMLPYALTVVAVAGLVGKVTGPAAAGKAYIKS